jgi:hypothetical protein
LGAIASTAHLDWIKWLVGLLELWLIVYLFLAQKKVYVQSWGTTVLKFLGLYAAYAVVLVAAVTVTGTLAFYFTA